MDERLFRIYLCMSEEIHQYSLQFEDELVDLVKLG
jgi:hypothetical protein